MNTRVSPEAVVAQEFRGRRLRALIAAETLDRQSEVLVAGGVDLDGYRRNPVVLWNHDANLPPIGRALSLEVEPGVGLWAETEFAPTPFAQELFELYRGGFLNGFSVGFRPLETDRRPDAHRPGRKVVTISRWELVEQSAVAVPANPDALVVAAAEGNRAAQWLDQDLLRRPNGRRHGPPAGVVPSAAEPSGRRGRGASTASEPPAAEAAGGSGPCLATQTKGDTMDELIQELRTIADQMRRDHDPERLQRAIAEVVTKSPGSGPGRLAALDAAGSEDASAVNLKGLMSRRARDGRELELQRLNDRVYLSSMLLRRDPRSLKSYGEFQRVGQELRKALNTVDNADFVPESFSVSLIEEVRLQRRLPLLFENVLLPRSPLRWPVDSGIGLPYLVGEQRSDTPDKVPTRTPGTTE